MEFLPNPAPNACQPELPPILLSAFAFDANQKMMRYLPEALAANGAWLLRHEVRSESVMRIVFEFERSAAIEIYTMLMSLGLELSRSSHLALTSFCNRTICLPSTEAVQVATCDLEIRECMDESSSLEPFFGESARA